MGRVGGGGGGLLTRLYSSWVRGFMGSWVHGDGDGNLRIESQE